jgi:membrane associated rhomboid family serine protease
MIPLSDSAPHLRFPLINYLLIALNVYVFYLELSSPNLETFINTYSFIPAHFSPFALDTYRPLFAGIFMHAGFLHIIGNMWFLHLFGDNVEGALGHFRYLIFYLLSGLAASLTQYFLDPGSLIPVLGASGAISGVMGAYLVLFRSHRIRTLIPFGFFWETVDLPSWIFLGYWFVLQLISGAGSLSSATSGGIAWFAHVGGFLFGVFAARLLQ